MVLLRLYICSCPECIYMSSPIWRLFPICLKWCYFEYFANIGFNSCCYQLAKTQVYSLWLNTICTKHLLFKFCYLPITNLQCYSSEYEYYICVCISVYGSMQPREWGEWGVVHTPFDLFSTQK